MVNGQATINCPACNETAGRFWRKKDGYDIFRCSACGHGVVCPAPGQDVIEQLYSKHSYGMHKIGNKNPVALLEQEKLFPNATLDADRMLRQAEVLLQSTGRRLETIRMLDVGCGYGFSAKLARERGFEVTALEVSSSGREITSKIAGIDPLPVSFEDYDPSSEFDVVLMSQVIEHMRDINLCVAKAHKMLANRGILILAMPNFNNIIRVLFGARDPYVRPPMHLNYFTPASSRALLKRHGCDAVRIAGVSRLGSHSLVKHLGLNLHAVRLIRLIRVLQDFPFLVCGLLGFPIMLNVHGQKQGGSS